MRGNATMRVKRTTGPTPNVALLQRLKCEHCDKCDAPPLLSWTVDGAIKRACTMHALELPADPYDRPLVQRPYWS